MSCIVVVIVLQFFLVSLFSFVSVCSCMHCCCFFALQFLGVLYHLASFAVYFVALVVFVFVFVFIIYIYIYTFCICFLFSVFCLRMVYQSVAVFLWSPQLSLLRFTFWFAEFFCLSFFFQFSSVYSNSLQH